MWVLSFFVSIGCVLLAVIFSAVSKKFGLGKKHSIGLMKALLIGSVAAACVLFFPVHVATEDATAIGGWQVLLLSILDSMEVLKGGCSLDSIKGGLQGCPDWLDMAYQVWAATLFVAAPVLTLGFILSFFRNLSASLRYRCAFFADVYAFSELNEKSLTLASDIKERNEKACIVFAGVKQDDEGEELKDAAAQLGSIFFNRSILRVNLKKHSAKSPIYLFAIGMDETNNLHQALDLIDQYKNRENTHLYAFSTKVESELLLTAVDKGAVRVRRVNEVHSLINRVLFEQGELLFDSALETSENTKRISAVVVGMGRHGTEMVKALTWFGQMDGYELHINAFDMDPMAAERFTMLAPELMSPSYNGVEVPGEASYKITIHSGMDVGCVSFADALCQITDATYVLVALGDDDLNISTAVNLRMYFERLKIHPVIQAIVYDSQRKRSLEGIKNYRGQAYDIQFIGDMENSYSEAVILSSELEAEALRRHLKWGREEDFWTYEYNYRSSVASAIHMKARIHCGISGADKKEGELTAAERDTIETLEHRRWNAYMRAEGYVYSGSTDKSSRNDLAKMHHDLVDFSSLTEEEKRKDSKVGTH